MTARWFRGVCAYIALSVTGQMVAALAIDHDGWLGVTQRPIDVPKMIGVAVAGRARGVDQAVSRAETVRCYRNELA